MLLDGDSPVAEVARTVGYDDPYHFSRVFKRVKGRPPSEFRRLTRGG
jgi:AraC-like DNA-binding protein